MWIVKRNTIYKHNTFPNQYPRQKKHSNGENFGHKKSEYFRSMKTYLVASNSHCEFSLKSQYTIDLQYSLIVLMCIFKSSKRSECHPTGENIHITAKNGISKLATWYRAWIFLSLTFPLLKSYLRISYCIILIVSFQFLSHWFAAIVTSLSFVYHWFRPRITLWSMNIHFSIYNAALLHCVPHIS